MAFSSAQLAPLLPELSSARRCYLGYSGGLDSHVLLHALQPLLPNLSAVHINHQLSPHAGQWAAHCAGVCAGLGVPLVSETVTLKPSGGGTEEAARRARYQVFERLLGEGDVLLLAHHRDDQVETVLYRLLRGAGPGGLAGIPERRPLGKGNLLRPLLGVSRQELRDYAIAEGLAWVEDESNADLHFDRNFIRHKVIDKVAERWPDYRKRLARSAALCGEASDLLAELAAQDLATLDERDERLGTSVAIDFLSKFHRSRQANLLRYWIGARGYPLPGHRPLATLLGQLEQTVAAMQIDWPGCTARKYRNRLYLLSPLPSLQPLTQPLAWQPETPLTLPDGSVLSATSVSGEGLLIPKGTSIQVSFRRGGERCTPVGRSGSNTLKTLFQEVGLEPWLRPRVPLLYSGGQLLAVGDLWVCEPFAATAGQSGYQLSWRYTRNS